MRAEQVYRAPMRSRDDDVPAGLAVERALELGLCGIGGRLDRSPDTLQDAVAATDRAFDERSARRLERFAAAPPGSFVWTADAYEFLWLGRINGQWSYDSGAGAWAVDLVHVRSCDWSDAPIPHADAPPSVHATFARGGRNWQRIGDPHVESQSDHLWERYGPDADPVTSAPAPR